MSLVVNVSPIKWSSFRLTNTDDILFKGKFSHERLRELQNLYRKITSGLTCSIGYGRSFQEVYLALKLAKTQPGKSAIVGLEFYQDNNLESSKS